MGAGVHLPGGLDGLFGELLGAGGHGDRVESEGGDGAVDPGSDPHVLRGRGPVAGNMCWRVTAYFTARPGTTWAASAASIMSAWGRPLDPKPPPTWGLMIRSRSGSMPRIGARVCFAGCAPWVEVHRVSVSPSQRALVVWGSIGLLCSIGVE